MSEPIEIPVALDTPLFTQRITLDGQEYILRFDWNGREGRWYLDIGDVDENWIVTGLKIVANWPLTRRCVDIRKPPGDLYAVDFSSQRGEPPILPELGRRVRLLYFPLDPAAQAVSTSVYLGEAP